jgi:two-component system chemotaxis response regulator CheB
VDALIRTAAVAKGSRVVGVVLTGARDDGTAGLRAIKRRGGVAVVQDPREALFPDMPESALRFVDVDHCLPLGETAPLLARLAQEEIPVEKEGASPVPDDMHLEARVAGLDPSAIDGDERPGQLSQYTCPDCSGPLYEIRDGRLLRFRRRVGHAYTAKSMLDEKTEALEDALYVALNTLEESGLMADTLAARSREQGHGHAAARFEKRARSAHQKAQTIRRLLTDGATETAS